MWTPGQELEFGNGQIATVVEVYPDGHALLHHAGMYAGAFMQDPDSWCLISEDESWGSLEQAIKDLYAQ